MQGKFKESKSLEDRKKTASDLLKKNSDRLPLIIEQDAKSKQKKPLEKTKYFLFTAGTCCPKSTSCSSSLSS